MRLANKIAIITGAGSGIGKSTALRFAAEGAVVIINDLHADHGSETAAEILAQNGQALFVQGDVTDSGDMQRLADTVIERYGRIDILFNNAGISGIGLLHEIEPEQWDRVMSVNVRGVYMPSKYVLPHMIKQRFGSVINMSSCIAEIGLARRAPYAAAKGAVLALTKSMQVDYASYGIRINALLPGTIFTPFVENYLQSSYDDPQAAIASLKKRQLSGELGKPEDIANGALFLASDESKFMMGAPFYIDGGATFGKDA